MFGRNGESPVAIVAPQSPTDCFDAAIEACRIATAYRTPVILLSDGYLANGSEPWRVPVPADLPALDVTFTTEPNGVDGNGMPVFQPYLRDPETLARPWAIPGTPGLEHRIGGIEKADVTGNISYDPDNHELMTKLRAGKIAKVADTIPGLEVDDPDGDARVLVIGWGSTYGPIRQAARSARLTGHRVATTHLRHLNPFPLNTGEVLGRYERVIMPEMNLGQCAMLLRAAYLVDVQSHTAVRGLPFKASELAEIIRTAVDGLEATK
jgi:2-oxoglutarate ferredoxin oxidoreductase subunit alpha